MGMFDSLRVKFPLPNPAHQDLTFQTKDLHCQMERYVILADGRLAKEIVEGEYIEDNKSLLGMSFRVDRRYWVRAYPSGGVRFYASTDAGWVDYVAHFYGGFCRDIEFLREGRGYFVPADTEIITDDNLWGDGE